LRLFQNPVGFETASVYNSKNGGFVKRTFRMIALDRLSED
jgi:hypothetical protein